MNLSSYLYTLNKNRSFALDGDEMKDVQSEISVYLLNKSYNDLLTKKTILWLYSKAVKEKIKREDFVLSENYLIVNEPGSHETELKRKAEIAKLKLSDRQKKIINLLISGFSYREIRKKMRLNNNQLVNQIARIKKNNLQP